jgi:hypothetical protein
MCKNKIIHTSVALDIQSFLKQILVTFNFHMKAWKSASKDLEILTAPLTLSYFDNQQGPRLLILKHCPD